nr:basic salivary proline-rich protein 1-like [Procambarus clarkii]
MRDETATHRVDRRRNKGGEPWEGKLPSQVKKTTGTSKATEAQRRKQEQKPAELKRQTAPRKHPNVDAPPHPLMVEGANQGPLGPQSAPGGQTDQGQTEQPLEPPQEPHQAPPQGENPPGNPHVQTSGESQPPRRPKGPQHEEHRNRPLRGPQRHTGNTCGSDLNNRSA